MAKRKNSRGGKRKRGSAITRGDLEAKRARKQVREAERADSEAPEGWEAADDAADEVVDADEVSQADGAVDADDERELAAHEAHPESASEPPSEAAQSRSGVEPAPDSDLGVGLPGGALWAVPLVRLQQRWTWLETRLMFGCLLLLTTILCFWIGVNGMKEPVDAQIPAGLVFRGLVGAALLGLLAYRLAASLEAHSFFKLSAPEGDTVPIVLRTRSLVACLGVVLGLLLAPTWRGFGIAYFESVLDWLQEGSTVTLFGGLRGISTRLTMIVALLGGSLAAASGTHINIDIVIRLLPRRMRKPVAIVSALATFVVCMAASWGFMDHLAVTEFGSPANASPSAKVSQIQHKLGEQFFVWRKQVALDAGALPYVLRGERWNSPERFSGANWNTLLDEGGFIERYGAEKVAQIRAPEASLNEPWTPFVIVPDEDTRGMLKTGLDLLWPFGFLVLALRFLVRAILILAGHIRVQVEGEELAEGNGPERAEEEAV